MGTGFLTISADDAADCAAGDTYTILAVIKTTGALTTAPTAANSVIDTTNVAVD